MDEKNYAFGATSEMPYAAKLANGYELESNDRSMRIVIQKRTYFDVDQNIQLDRAEANYLVKVDKGWQRADGSFYANSMKEIIERLSKNERFTKALGDLQNQTVSKNE
jgi:hypothetical protein